VIGLAADLVWRARRARSITGASALDESMERLNRIGQGDRDSTRYGMDLAQTDERTRET
jgi:hypothetical protein